MLRKTIEIGTPGTRLSVAHRQLRAFLMPLTPAFRPVIKGLKRG